jgi:alpha-galactosidase
MHRISARTNTNSRMRILIALVFWTLFVCARCLNNGLGRTPPMGWNSWNIFKCDINETKILDVIDAFVQLQLPRYGYQYVNLDDCWAVGRDADNVLIPDPVRFPRGIKYLADYAHSKGLKLGIYSDCGTHTCAGRPGSLGYETIDANTWASWGIDYLKYDNCYTSGPEVPPLQQRYSTMRDALNKTGRPIFYSLCEWGYENPWRWAQSIGNSWRTTTDINDFYSDILRIIDDSVGLSRFAGPGGWNDPDMLEVGNGGMTDTEDMIHFAFWCLLKAPLILGNDLTKIRDTTLRIITHTELIALNQDPLGIQGDLIAQEGPMQTWATTLNDGSRAFIFFNRQFGSQMTVDFRRLGYRAGTTALVRDILNKKDLGHFTNSFTTTVADNSIFVGKITPTVMYPEYKDWRPWNQRCFN